MRATFNSFQDHGTALAVLADGPIKDAKDLPFQEGIFGYVYVSTDEKLMTRRSTIIKVRGFSESSPS